MSTIVQYLADHRFADLFREELGWDRASGVVALDIDGRHLSFEAVAQKRGFHVLHCTADRRALFNKGLLRRAQHQIARSVHEHVLIYSCNDPPKQVWQWSIRLPDGRKLRHREHPFFSCSPPAPFLSRLSRLRFSIDEESNMTLVDALDRVRVALDLSADLNLFVKRPWFAERSDELAVAMASGEPSAFGKFVLFHRPLSRHLSKWLQRSYGMDAEDAEQIGVIGLIEAAKRFNPERGFQFSTYASYWIRQACQRLGPDAALCIRLPTHILQSLFPFRRHLERLASEFGPAIANEELVRRCMADERFFCQWLGFERALNVRSLSDRHEPEYRQAQHLVAPAFKPLDQHVAAERAATVRAAIDRLRPRDGRFMRLRHGIDGAPQTLEEIGRAEGLTRERVRQILKRGEDRLRILLSHELDIEKPVAEPLNGSNAESTSESVVVACDDVRSASEANF